jgi:hypothetical protein
VLVSEIEDCVRLDFNKNMTDVVTLLLVFFSLAAGHFADALIQNRWTVLSVRRLMTAIGLLGPALFMLLFISVDNLLLAVV